MPSLSPPRRWPGLEVSPGRSGEASWLALPGRAGDIVLPHATPLADLLEVVLGEGTVTLCTQCAARRGIAGDEMLRGIPSRVIPHRVIPFRVSPYRVSPYRVSPYRVSPYRVSPYRVSPY